MKAARALAVSAGVVLMGPFGYGQARFDPDFRIGLVPPSSWKPLKECPRGYPSDNFRFGWKRQVGDKHAVLVVTTLPIEVDDKSRVDVGWIGGVVKGFFEDSGAKTRPVEKKPISGRLAAFIKGTGVGDGMAIAPRLGAVSTTQEWAVLLPSKDMALRIQFAAPEELFDLLRPDFEAALGTVSFGSPAKASPNEGVPQEKLEAVYGTRSPAGVAPMRAQTDARGSSQKPDDLLGLTNRYGIPAGIGVLAFGVVAAASRRRARPRHAVSSRPSPFQEDAAPLRAEQQTMVRAVVSEKSFLSADQWESLESLARSKGTHVGALLRHIVDRELGGG